MYIPTEEMDVDRLISKKIVLIYTAPVSLVLPTLLRFSSPHVLINEQS